MRCTFSEQQIADIELIVREELIGKLRAPGKGDRYAFGGEILSSLVDHVVIPILVSLSSRSLYDVLKGRILGHLGKKEADALKEELRSHEIQPGGAPITPECLDVLRKQLGPHGFSEIEITVLYASAKCKLTVEPSADSAAEARSSDT